MYYNTGDRGDFMTWYEGVEQRGIRFHFLEMFSNLAHSKHLVDRSRMNEWMDIWNLLTTLQLWHWKRIYCQCYESRIWLLFSELLSRKTYEGCYISGKSLFDLLHWPVCTCIVYPPFCHTTYPKNKHQAPPHSSCALCSCLPAPQPVGLMRAQALVIIILSTRPYDDGWNLYLI